MNLCGLTDVGLQRANNQDTFRQMELEEARGLFVVCDGMGGAQAGNIASEIAASVFLEHLKRYIRPTMSSRYAESILVNAINFANYEVYKKSMSDASYSGMGTTLVGGFIQHGEIMLANIGDSRAYRCVRNPENGWKLERITRDHSVVEEMLLRGDLTEEQARRHPRRNLITRALGVEETVKPDVYLLQRKEGSYLLLCSDGLSNTVTDPEIQYEVIHGGEPEDCCQRLLDIALMRGAPDNVTAVLVQL